jgi:peptide/nickel transport system ATP-binding protein
MSTQNTACDMPATEMLRVNDLQTEFRVEEGVVRAVNHMSYTINEREIVGVVGESGCGKSVSQLRYAVDP